MGKVKLTFSEVPMWYDKTFITLGVTVAIK